ncbi:hypothetical protein HPT25_04005 [Bacillus sp. BRMEA1]|uniref:hypothetical protein n=1 Tax=Neobacillus endophyticus TaxID=2738405 RepID=UPI0015646478|nr:hypothetical protein [Neobacillus endophyticus]NRD76653.1 hypothetical protein [Neobacillus endophyticus]
MTDEEKIIFMAKVLKQHHHSFEYMVDETLKEYVELISIVFKSSNTVNLAILQNTMNLIVRNTMKSKSEEIIEFDDDAFPGDGIWAIPGKYRVRVRSLYDYCKLKNCLPEDLTPEEMERFLEKVELEEIIPIAKGQEIDYYTLRGFPEKFEIAKGELLWSEEEKKQVILGVLKNTGLRFFVSILPKDSLSELKKLLPEYDVDSSC